MKTGKLLTAIKDFFDESGKKQRNQRKYLKEVMVKLKRKAKALRKKLDNEKNVKDSKIIRKEYDVICAQRKKGLKLLKRLNKD